MRQSVLDITQEILASLDSDEVNSIEDTIESRQVAKIIRRVYNDIIARANLPEHQSLFQLDSSGDITQPVLMSKPDNVKRIDWIKYNVYEDVGDSDNYDYVDYRPLQVFLDYTQRLDTDDTEVSSMLFDGTTYYFTNDRRPRYYTTIGDKYLIFDAYDNSVDTTLQSSKTLGFGLLGPVFLLQDDYIPEMDEAQYPLLVNEAKSLAFYELKQITHEKAEVESRRQWRTMQKSKDLAKGLSFDNLPDFGRSRHGVWRSIRS